MFLLVYSPIGMLKSINPHHVDTLFDLTVHIAASYTLSVRISA